MKNNKFLILVLIPLLMSNSGNTHFNELKYNCKSSGDDTLIYKLISAGSKSGFCPSNILNNEAGKITVHYDFLEKHKDYGPYNGYKKSYHLLYRLDIKLDNNVHYKGGVGNRFNGYNPCYINYLNISATFQSSSFKDKLYIVTSPKENNHLDETYKMLEQINPNTDKYGETAFNEIVEKDISFDANNGYESTSFSKFWRDAICEDDFYTYNSKLVAQVLEDRKISDTSLLNETRMYFGNELTKDKYGNTILNTKERNNLYSGPNKDDVPFNFSIFGVINIQNDYDITSAKLNVKMNTSHGSTVWLDTFSSSTEISINLM